MKQPFRDIANIAITFYTQRNYKVAIDITEDYMPIYIVLRHKTEDKAVYINQTFTDSTTELTAIECSGSNYGCYEFYWGKQVVKQLASAKY